MCIGMADSQVSVPLICFLPDGTPASDTQTGTCRVSWRGLGTALPLCPSHVLLPNPALNPRCSAVRLCRHLFEGQPSDYIDLGIGRVRCPLACVFVWTLHALG